MYVERFKGKGLTLILVLDYVGEGWAPKGLDTEVWPLIPNQPEHYIFFLRRKDFLNVVYLLASEGILPATLLYNPAKRSECIEAFRDWAKEKNPIYTIGGNARANPLPGRLLDPF